METNANLRREENLKAGSQVFDLFYNSLLSIFKQLYFFQLQMFCLLFKKFASFILACAGQKMDDCDSKMRWFELVTCEV